MHEFTFLAAWIKKHFTTENNSYISFVYPGGDTIIIIIVQEQECCTVVLQSKQEMVHYTRSFNYMTVYKYGST